MAFWPFSSCGQALFSWVVPLYVDHVYYPSPIAVVFIYALVRMRFSEQTSSPPLSPLRFPSFFVVPFLFLQIYRPPPRVSFLFSFSKDGSALSVIAPLSHGRLFLGFPRLLPLLSLILVFSIRFYMKTREGPFPLKSPGHGR